jgi:nicotinamidase-related amidase
MALLDRDDSVLVVVDAQPGFLADEAEPAVERMEWLVALAARLGVPVVVTEEEPDRNGATDARVAARLPAAEGVVRNHAKGVTYEWLRTVDEAHAVLGDPALPPVPFRL